MLCVYGTSVVACMRLKNSQLVRSAGGQGADRKGTDAFAKLLTTFGLWNMDDK